ncbi:hypothetical protein [Paracoccus luteus]|uniref:hypothetical protein n=1 Tax=Paracoccus luteus TaxID=2508543 RepID=UPI00106F7E16|nr:hypothetical protein [Paracoccus luteus]
MTSDLDDVMYAVDADAEIAGLELEIEDIRRDIRWCGALGAVGLVLLLSFGDHFVPAQAVYIGCATIVVLAGLKEHLHRNRMKAAQSELNILKLLTRAELHRGRHTGRILQVIRQSDKPQSS